MVVEERCGYLLLRPSNFFGRFVAFTDKTIIAGLHESSQILAREYLRRYYCKGCDAQAVISDQRIRVYHEKYCYVHWGLISRHPAARSWGACG